MNERLKELGHAAGFAFIEDGVYGQRWYSSKCGMDASEFEKFAELIIKECVSVSRSYITDRDIDNYPGWNIGYNAAAEEISEALEDHFIVRADPGPLFGIKVGQTFGIGQGKPIDIWCRVTEIRDDTVVYFRVINGAWQGSLSLDQKSFICYAPDGNTSHVITTMCLAEIPDFDEEYYNEAVAWMNGELTEDLTPYLKKKFVRPASWDDDDIAF
jgi:hypothetical protein